MNKKEFTIKFLTEKLEKESGKKVILKESAKVDTVKKPTVKKTVLKEDSESSESFNKKLGAALKKLGIPFAFDRKYAAKMWGLDTLLLKLKTKKGTEFYAGADGYSFAIDNISLSREEEIELDDIGTVKEAILFIKQIYETK